MTTQVKLYTRKQCPLCDDAKALLLMLQHEFDFSLEEVDIYQNDALLEKYQIMIPVVEIDGDEVDYGVIDLMLISTCLEEKKKR